MWRSVGIFPVVLGGEETYNTQDCVLIRSSVIHKKLRALRDVSTVAQSDAIAASALEFLWAESRFRFRVFSYPSRCRSPLWLWSYIRNFFGFTID